MSKEAEIKRYVPRGNSDWESKVDIQLPLDKENKPVDTRKNWSWNKKNSEPGPVTIYRRK